MGHFSFSYSSSDSDHENAVEELLSQFLDEDLLKITTNPIGSQGSTGHGLDPELESRYEKLKASVSKLGPTGSPQSLKGHHGRLSESAEAQLPVNNLSSSAGSPRDSNSSPISEGYSTSAVTTPKGDSNSRLPKKTSRSFMASSPSVRSRRSCSLSPSPPRSCFCGSPKKLLRSLSSKRSSVPSKMNKSNSHIGDDELMVAVVSENSKMRVRNQDRERDRPKDELNSLSDDESLTDLGTFSLKSQRKQFKKALREEQKVNRDAEDLVKWVKQASARMDDRVLDNLLSDEEEFK